MATSRVKTSDMALTILEKIAFADVPMNQKEIADAMGIVKSAAHKHLNTLEETGWVMRDLVTGRYQLGTKAWIIGQRASAIQTLANVGREPMRIARNETGLAVVLSLVNKNGLSVISALHGTHAIEIGVREGSELPIHSSAQGQVAMAFGGPALTEKTLKGDLPALTPNTVTDPERLKERIAEVRAKGYACAPEETLLGVNVIAAPIFDHTRTLIGTAALVGSIQHLAHPPDPQHLAALKAVAASISQARGYIPG